MTIAMMGMERHILLTASLLLLVVVGQHATSKVDAAASSANTIVHSIQDDLSYDENDKLRKHYIVYPENAPADCGPKTANFNAGERFDVRSLSGKALSDVFGEEEKDTSSTECRAACIERGTDKSVAHAVMPHMLYDLQNGHHTKDFTKWFEETCSKVEVCLMNYYDREHPIQTFWFPLDGKEKQKHVDIYYGNDRTMCFKSWIGHHFQVADHTGEVIIDEFTIEYALVKGFGESPPSDDANVHTFEAEITNDLKNEWTRHNIVKRTFSPLGFDKGRLPSDVFAAMGAFFYNNKFNKVREEWQGRGVFVNWWETDVFFIQIPWDIKARWQLRLLHMVEAWAGVPVEQTVMYGLRQYESGARLLTHVDRLNTHAVSMIVNVAQGNLTEPWPVEVHDHADRLHEVIMEPGDVVYYESAKCLHGRNRPMVGKNAYYVNLFTHYRPLGDDAEGDDLWYEKPNHDGAPPPVVEAVGECHMKQVGVAETPSHTLGMLEAVVCDDKRLGPYISPALFTATKADDLVSWWRQTSPPSFTGGSGVEQQCEQ